MAYLANENITLRALEPEDLDTFYRWENNSELWLVGNSTEPCSRYLLKEYIAYSNKTIYEKHQLRLMIERNFDKTLVGAIDLYDFDPFHLRAGIGILIDTPFRQQGYAQETLSLLIDYAFSFLHLHQLYAHVPTNNQASLSVFQQAKFETCGTLKQWLHIDNDYSDVAVFQLINEHK